MHTSPWEMALSRYYTVRRELTSMSLIPAVLTVDIMVVAGGIKPPRVTLTRIEYFGKQEETLKH